MKTTLTTLMVLMSFVIYAQKPVTQYSAEELFANKGEIYFLLKGAAHDAEKLTKIISIDNVKDGDIYAYASVKQFNTLKSQFNYTLYNLPKPSELIKADMSNSSREILDWNYYPTYSGYLQLMQDFATNFPSICKIDTIGTTIENRLIIAARISDNAGMEEDEPEFLYTSSMHGDEVTGYILTLHLIDYLLTNYGIDDRVTNMVNNMDIWINPLANPDGTYAGGDNSVNGAQRYNANYIDLNRNYPDPNDGPHPDGEQWQPETVAFMNFAENRDFVLSANFHGGAEVVNYPWDTWSKLTADNAWWVYVSREYADTVHLNAAPGYMSDLNNGVTNGYAWYRVTGGRQDYMNYFQQCREVTIELSSIKLLPTSQLLNLWNYNYRSLLNYMDESLYGVRGIITDTVTGEPILAQVYINNHDQDSSMVFSSSPIGNYHRLLKAGTYNLTYVAEGYIPRTVKNVVVNDHSTNIINVKLWDGKPIPLFTSSDTMVAPENSLQFFDISGGSPTSRLWTFEGGTPATSNEINPMVKYNQVGSYNVTLRVTNLIGSNTVVKNDYITVKEGVDVKNIDISNVNVFPNPLTGNLLNIKSVNTLKRYQLTELTGKIIMDGNIPGTSASINLTSVANGIYVLHVVNEKGFSTFKIVINH